MPGLGLGGGGEDGLGQLGGFDEAFRHLLAADGAALLVFREGGAGQVAPDHALHGEDLGLLHDHGPAVQIVGVGSQLGIVFANVAGNVVVFDFVSEEGEPEFRKAGEDLAFVRDQGGQNAVVSRNAVGGDEEKVLAQIVNFTYLAALQKRILVDLYSFHICPFLSLGFVVHIFSGALMPRMSRPHLKAFFAIWSRASLLSLRAASSTITGTAL